MTLDIGLLPFADSPSAAGQHSPNWAETATEAARCLTSIPSSITVNTSTRNHSHTDTNTTPEPQYARRTHSRAVRARLSLACDPCRRRKVRCDEGQPKCRNCTSRGDDCTTSDLRRPNAPMAKRRRAVRRKNDKEQQRGSDDEDSKEESEEQLREQPQFDCHQPLPSSPISAASAANNQKGNERRHSGQVNSEIMESVSVSQENQHTSISQFPHVDRNEAAFDPASVRSHSTTAQTSRHGSSVGRHQHTGNRDDMSWFSRAYNETSKDQGQKTTVAGLQDPSAVSPDVVIHTDGSPYRIKVLGGSSLHCLFNFVDLWLFAYGFDSTAPLFRHGKELSEEFHLPLFFNLPDLPLRPLISRCIEAFLGRVWPVFPIIDEKRIFTLIDTILELQLQSPGSIGSQISQSQIPNLAIVYAILCIGLGEIYQLDGDYDTLDMRTSYLKACYGLQSHLNAMPYYSSVQALVLIAISLRSFGKDGQASYMSGQARQRLVNAEGIRRRLWWSCFSLEKLLQIECGRSSGINSENDYEPIDDDGYVFTPEVGGEIFQDEDPLIFFKAWVSLANIMGEISDRLYTRKFTCGMDMFEETAGLTRKLAMWEAALPENVKPHYNTFGPEPANRRALAVFLAQQFHQAQIAVFRTAILFPGASFENRVQQWSQDKLELKALLGVASLCITAARNLITQTLQLADAEDQAILKGAPQITLASVTLALSILRAPTSRLARSDVELLTSATTYVEGLYKAWGYPTAFLSILSRLRERTSVISRGEATFKRVARLTSSDANGLVGQIERSAVRTPGVSQEQPDDYRQGNPLCGGLSSFTDIGFEDVWNMLETDIFVYNIGE
ncbi:uncharacterized protein B0J16DRAFT_402285 [Fusarium flagelliforme]|uniref:uncharacterized protein n=1 Tax=Fusarium flagelliforme TaxID=2675880 RepID=UPI001E8D7867|nr:uncharacterized protein B0J16DRAFT_402285 [Fusarium flagelliforme]KAH7178960.1 hypothetical protein B0J16DRAFT_402285 [Fusarium flagelliforme]